MNYYLWLIFKYEGISIEVKSLTTSCLSPTEIKIQALKNPYENY